MEVDVNSILLCLALGFVWRLERRREFWVCVTRVGFEAT